MNCISKRLRDSSPIFVGFDVSLLLVIPASRVIYVHAERQYEGRKPQATITIAWDGDRYFFKLIVDGEERMQSEEREELKAEAQRLGAELEETHTP